MDVKILGSGCSKCNELEKSTVEALAELGIEAVVDHVTDFADIAKYGVMQTPALVNYLPILLAIAIPTGFSTGLVAKLALPAIRQHY